VEIVTMPAIAQQGRNYMAFARSMRQAWKAVRAEFLRNRPQAVLAMGGFTSAPPIWAGRGVGALTFLHESNTVPGRANRFLAHFVHECFVGFEQTAERLWNPRVTWTGTPARSQFVPTDRPRKEASRAAFGLNPSRPVLVVTGGSQGAAGLNRLFLEALPALVAAAPDLQYIHLTGTQGLAAAQSAHAKLGCRSVVQPFLAGMDAVLSAATVVISRAGASSISELAAMRLPSILVPLPTAQDNHQYFNAQALVDSGAAVLIQQDRIRAEEFALAVLRVVTNPVMRESLASRIGACHVPDAAERIANRVLSSIGARCTFADSANAPAPEPPGRSGDRCIATAREVAA
jgi:UDP-N-acetylglucosamine--N-acetylmuramyl-(pentapeptide) pyrophosphoryl-undecaprenol N-acetylglucosamine transferase